MSAAILGLFRRSNVECAVCHWRGPRSRMWRNAPGVYVCRSEAMCAFRHDLPVRLEMDRERQMALKRRREQLEDWQREAAQP